MSTFPVLNDHDYLNYVDKLSHRGANTSIHLAEIRYPVQRAGVVSVVKLMPPDGIGVCNEAIAWLFLRAAGLASPKNAGILVMTEEKAKAVLGSKAVPKDLVSEGYVLAWAAQKLEFSSICALFSGSEADTKWLDLLRTDAGAGIAAFDELLHNQDRNTGNILFRGRGSCVPIDHEQVFARQNWMAADLQHLAENGDSFRMLRRAHAGRKLSSDELARITDAMIAHSHGHAGALDVCRKQIGQLLGRLFSVPKGTAYANRILSFIGERCSERWMQQRVGALT
ncbi:hypothetical protein GCM10027082_36390 [Comamonas humi]